MRAVVQDRFGPPDVLEVREVDEPEAGAGEVLVRVRAASGDGALAERVAVAETTLAPTPGRRVLVNGASGGVGTFALQLAKALGAEVTVVFFISRSSGEDLMTLAELLEAGTVTPCVERTCPLDDAAEALRHLGQGRARGKLVVTVPTAQGR